MRKVVAAGARFTALALALATAGCGASNAWKSSSTSRSATPARGLPGAGASCARTAGAAALVPIGEARQSGAIALAELGGRTIAFVADEDARAIIAFDADAKKELATTALDGAPSHLLITREGRVLVALRDRARVVVLEASSPEAPLLPRCAIATAAEPIALATTPDDATVLVSSGWGAALAAFDATTLVKRFEVPLRREPRAVLVTDDGKTAIVAHAVGSILSRVDLGKRLVREIGVGEINDDGSQSADVRQRRSCQNFALAKSVAPRGRLLAPQVMVDAGDPAERADGYGSLDQATETASVAVVDDASWKPLAESLGRSDLDDWVSSDNRPLRPCLLPRAAAIDPSSSTLLVACFGSDALIAFDAMSPAPAFAEKHRWKVGSGPTGVAVDAARSRALVWSQFDRTVHVVSLATIDELSEEKDADARGVERFPLAASSAVTLSTRAALGRELFHATFDPRISKDGRACASCHPDGRDDALTWATPEGPRRTILLAGRVADTAPYGWSGGGIDLDEHLGHTFDRLSGSGLGGIELRALEEYIATLRPPAPPPDHDEKIARGDELFHAAEVGCASCHQDGAFTDHLTHDIGSGTPSDRTTAFDTPSLRFVSKRGPYFHDGRFTSLRELLRGSDATMGHTGHLSLGEMDALEAYLRSL